MLTHDNREIITHAIHHKKKAHVAEREKHMWQNILAPREKLLGLWRCGVGELRLRLRRILGQRSLQALQLSFHLRHLFFHLHWPWDLRLGGAALQANIGFWRLPAPLPLSLPSLFPRPINRKPLNFNNRRILIIIEGTFGRSASLKICSEKG